MRPEKAYRIVSNAIQKTLASGDTKHLKQAEKAINKLLAKCALRGDDTKKFYADCISLTNLSYISDRFNCSGRLRWLLWLADNVEQMQDDW